MMISENQPDTISVPFSPLDKKQSIVSVNVQGSTGSSSENKVSTNSKFAYTVNISQEAKELQTQEKGEVENGETEKEAKGESPEEISLMDETSGETLSEIDEQIKRIQEKIKEIKEEIAELADDDSEEAQQQLRDLETQLFELTNQLMSLLEQKMGSG